MLQEILNGNFDELLRALQQTGKFTYDKDGLKIDATADGNTTSISCSFTNVPQVDPTQELKDNFNAFLENLNDDFFAEICDSYKEAQLDKVQSFINSDKPAEVVMGIEDFMAKAKICAKKNIAEIDEEIIKLNNIRASYVDVLKKQF